MALTFASRLALLLDSMSAANALLDTASQRPATGMDRSARRLILDALRGVAMSDMV